MPGNIKGDIERVNLKKLAIADKVRQLFQEGSHPLCRSMQFKTDDVVNALGLTLNGSNRILTSKGISAMGRFKRRFIKGNVEDGGGYFFIPLEV